MKRSQGFTIVELAVVITIIGILAAITIVSYNGVKTRAQASAISDGLRKVDKSLQIWGVRENFKTWPEDPVVGGGTPLNDLIAANPRLQNVLQSAPKVTGIHSEAWFYDNDGDEKGDCTGDPYDGVNVVIRYITDTKVAQIVDDTIDDGNLLCGQVKYVDERIFYAVSNVQKF